MIIKMNATSAGPDHCLIGTVIYDVPAELGKRMLNSKTASGHPAAELVSDAKERAKARKMERPVQNEANTWEEE